ncbi:TPA: alpha/beta fold hydrolase [Pseudomonas aeruginosa]|nr:alpha/beta fold hydrolase [Pseudomonas aeruginosa]HEJ6151356.1 alpha/beta fold hydrolase [Pseudomonas aeruginosa]
MMNYPVTAAGVRTRILQGGREGPAVILLHGLSARADRWRHNLDTLGAAGVRAMAIDLPGHGLAHKGVDFDYSAKGYSHWLEALLTELGLERVVLVGTSFGGLIAASYAADHPERVLGLMAVGAIGLVPSGPERCQRTVAWLQEMRRDQIRERMKRGVVDQSLITEELVEEDWRINNSAGAAEAFQALGQYYLNAIDADSAAPRVAALGARFPTQLVWGEFDQSVAREYGERAQQTIPDATLHIVPDCAHFPYWERPQEFNRLVLDFVRHCTGQSQDRKAEVAA